MTALTRSGPRGILVDISGLSGRCGGDGHVLGQREVCDDDRSIDRQMKWQTAAAVEQPL